MVFTKINPTTFHCFLNFIVMFSINPKTRCTSLMHVIYENAELQQTVNKLIRQSKENSSTTILIISVLSRLFFNRFWFQFLSCDELLLLFVLSDSELNIYVFTQHNQSECVTLNSCNCNGNLSLFDLYDHNIN